MIENYKVKLRLLEDALIGTNIKCRIACRKEIIMNIPQVVIPTDKVKLQRQIEALEYFLQHDTDQQSIEIHTQALKQLKKVKL